MSFRRNTPENFSKLSFRTVIYNGNPHFFISNFEYIMSKGLSVEVLLLLIIQISSALANSFFCELVPPLFVIRFLRIQLGLYINHILLTLMV